MISNVRPVHQRVVWVAIQHPYADMYGVARSTTVWFDLSAFIRNVAVAGALTRAENRGYDRGYSAARLIWSQPGLAPEGG